MPRLCSGFGLVARVLRITLRLEQMVAFHNNLLFKIVIMKNLGMKIYEAWVRCLGRAISDRNTSIIAIIHSFLLNIIL